MAGESRLRALWQRWRKPIIDAIELRDCFCFAGLAACVYGVSMIYVPAAWIVAGVVLFWLGVRT